MIHSIVFDWKRTLYDPDDKRLIDGAKELLQLLKQHNIPMILIGKGGSDMYDEVERLGIKNFFKDILFQEGQKEISIFNPYISKTNSKSTFFIGDRIRSELEIGNSLQATTIWVKQGKFAAEEPLNDLQKPSYILHSLPELEKFLENQLL